MADKAQQLFRELNEVSKTQCLCHNDLNSANIIEGQGLTLIDWEYAAIGDPLFDLATIAEHHQYDASLTKVLLDAYFNPASDEVTDRLKKYRVLYRCLLVLWLEAVKKLCGLDAQQTNQLQQARAALC